MNIKKGDKILITKGKNSGKSAIVDKVYPKQDKILVNGVNVYKKHLKPSKKNPHGGIINMTMPIARANAMIICPSCNKKTRITYKIVDGKKIRICKKCKQALNK